MDIYDDGCAASSARKQKRRRRDTSKAWASINGNVRNQHERLKVVEPNSPRIRPSLGTVGWILPS